MFDRSRSQLFDVDFALEFDEIEIPACMNIFRLVYLDLQIFQRPYYSFCI